MNRKRFLDLIARGGVVLMGRPSALWSGAAVDVSADPNRAATAAGGGSIVEQSLLSPSSPMGPTMFKLLSPEDTGVVTENPYDDPRMWGSRYNVFEIGAMGTGVAIGDYDNDGRPDIFVVSKTRTCRLFRNLGNFKFEDVTEKAGVGQVGSEAQEWKQGVTFVDVNNNGLLDIYICRFNAPNLLYINQGDGTFKEAAAARGLAVKDACVMAAFCDYDRDGWLDVFIQTNLLDEAHPLGQRDYLFHNNGDGTFTDVTAASGIWGEAQGHSAIWWDFDGDGWPDLYVANDFESPDKLYRNNRNGTFTDVIDSVVPHMPFSSMGSDLGDINNDGIIDFMVADMKATTREKDQRSSAVMRSGQTDPAENSSSAPQIMRNALYINVGRGRVLEAACLAGISATDWTWSVRLEDLDNDGRLDLFVTNGMNRETHNADLTVRRQRAQSFRENLRLEWESPALVERHLAYRNMGDLRFEDVSTLWGLDQMGVSFGTALGDLNGDGNLDIVYSNFGKGVTLLRNDANTGHRIILVLRGAISNRFGVGAMARIETDSGIQVRSLVLSRGILSSSEPIVHFGLGNDIRVNHLTVSWPSGHVQVFTSLAADRRYTIMEPSQPITPPPAEVPAPGQFREMGADSNFSFNSREIPVDETAKGSLLPMRQNRRGPALAVGDLNGDGKDDVVMGGTPIDPARILLRNHDGAFTESDSTVLANDGVLSDGPLLIFDADGDGKNDILVTKGGVNLPSGSPSYQPKLFLNDGFGVFRQSPESALPPLPISVGAVAAADFDRSGRLGLFVGARVLPGSYPCASRSSLLANLGGRFEDVTDRLAPALRGVGMVTSALWSDVDGDGWPDLLITVEWGHVMYFHNNSGQGFEDWTERAGFGDAGTGWWTSIASADFNGDGRPDFVCGNLGLNTEYSATKEHPALLYVGDFNGDGRRQLVEAYYEGDRIYPRRTLSDLAAGIPSVARHFQRNDHYARATLGEVLGDEQLAKAERFVATEFRSGIFLSQPNGTYRFEPLPRIAQISPIQGLVACDLDGDGHADIFAIQNSYSPVPYVGRFDGGLGQMLRGDGRGGFSPVPILENNLVVPGDAKALALIDLDDSGWPGFLVTRNNETTMEFRNSGVPGHHSQKIALRGRPGNPTAIGARVTVEFIDGSTQTNEVFAGSGCYSQSTASCFVGWRAGNAPSRFQIRWPWGATSQHDYKPVTGTLTLWAP